MSKKEKYVAIRLSSSRLRYSAGTRYLADIDEHWYETTDTPIYKFKESDMDTIKGWMASHFINFACIIHQDGTEETWEAFKPVVKKITPTFKLIGSIDKIKLTFKPKK